MTHKFTKEVQQMNIYRRVSVVCAVVILLFSLTVFPASAKTFKVTVAAGHPTIFLFISTIHDTFIPYVDQQLAPLGHKIEWKEAYAGTVVKIGGELKALESGIVEMCNIGTVFEASKMPLHSVSFYAPFGSNDIGTISDIMIELREKIPAVRDEWANHNMVNLGNSGVDTYNIYSKFPIKSVDDVKGHKLGTAGSMATWLKGTGGIAVATSLPEAYNSVQLGVFEGYIVFDSAALGIRLYEVAPHIAQFNFGAMYGGGLGISKKFFETLPPEVQKVFVEGGKVYSKKYAELANGKAQDAKAVMAKAGATFVPISDEERAKWAKKMPNIAMEWADSMEKKGLPGKQVLKAYLDGLRKRGVKLVRDWDKE
jgi:TRAP-type transport system periplasmic protein